MTRSNNPEDGFSLPAWTYSDPEFFALEMERVMRPSWQIVCHESDIAHAGDYHLLEFLNESIVVMRGHDGRLNAFTNVCRHRGAKILEGPSGHAKSVVCPYHSWTYNLDGSLRGIPHREAYGEIDTANLCLPKIEL